MSSGGYVITDGHVIGSAGVKADAQGRRFRF